VACDIALVATGGEAPPWLAGSGLALDAQGFVRIGPTLQSVSHAEVFAAGDVSARDDRPHPRNGVHAIRAGAVLAHNLRQALKGGPLQPYRPPSSTLALLDLTDGRAIASRGAWSAQGWLMGAWKRHIDRAFMARWQRTPATAAQPPKK
jgi:NADH dehydrogenase FAD-containing subunit